MSRFDQLLDFLLTVPSIVVLASGIILCVYAAKHLWMRWALFGGFMYVASLSKYYDIWEERLWDPLNPPIEVLANNGRPLAILCLFALLGVETVLKERKVAARIAPLMMPIHCIQALILLKVISGEGGDQAYVVQALVIYLGIGYLASSGLRNWALVENPVEYFSYSLLIVGALFSLIAEWHLFTNPSAVFLRGRLMGTTGNPQHAAVLLGLCLLGPVYLLASYRTRPIWMRFGCTIAILCMLHLLLLTGSRTGVGLAAIGTSIMLWGRVKIGFLVIVSFSALVGVVIQWLGQSESVEFVARTDDTRSQVWAQQWNTFLNYPVFGEPHRGAQFRVGENSWLGLMAAAGMAGVVFLGWFLKELLVVVRNLWGARLDPRYSLEVRFCIAALTTVLAGSFFEGYLLGIVSLPVLFIAATAVVSDQIVYQARSHTTFMLNVR